MIRRYILLALFMVLCSGLRAQNFSTNVTLVEESGNTATFEAIAIGVKKKDAAELAAKSAFNTLFHTGVEGLKNGVPMIMQERKDYDYRFFNESRYLNFLSGEILTVDDSKIGGSSSRCLPTLSATIWPLIPDGATPRLSMPLPPSIPLSWLCHT